MMVSRKGVVEVQQGVLDVLRQVVGGQNLVLLRRGSSLLLVVVKSPVGQRVCGLLVGRVLSR
jgi:hypothetical protein